MTPTIGIGMTVFNSPMRLRKILEIVDQFGRPKRCPIRVFEDPWRDHVAVIYEKVCKEFGVEYHRIPKDHRVVKDPATGWSCMQGSIEYAVEKTPEDWFFYFPDDVLPTPGAIGNALGWVDRLDHTSVGAFELPYWNADDLPTEVRPWPEVNEYRWAKEAMWFIESDWLRKIPENPHWNGPDNAPRPYVNLNGAGFLLRRKAWEMVGGFSQETWCLDEDISAKIWLRTPYSIVTVPGPAWVHHFGASLEHPPHDYNTHEAWMSAGWPPKADVDREVRKMMAAKCGDERGWYLRYLRGEQAEVA